jgi:N-acetylglucosamine kinase-like BadF-type ATPase
MGDEGSGYDIGRAALRAATSASDGRAMSTLLVRAIPAHFGLADLYAVHRAIYGGDIDRPKIAGLAQVVSTAAGAGDEPARALLADAGHQLAQGALAVISQLGGRDAGLTAVYPTGGVLGPDSIVTAAFREAVEAGAGGLRVETAAFSPVVGALLLGLQAAGTALDNTTLAAVRATMPAAAVTKNA